MEKLTINDIEKNGLLLYRFKRGSLAQGCYIEGKSDIDHCSVYLAPPNQLLGLGFDYQDEVSDDKHDDCAWEFNKFMRLLLKSNPTVLEALFVDDEFVEYEHPIITELKKSRDKFVTKKCFDSFGAYAVSQIKKARSLNKKVLHDAEGHIERKGVMDFCYTFHKQGSTKILKWLANRGLRTEYCGLNKIPNMRDSYGVFYDWGRHFEECRYTPDEAIQYLLTLEENNTNKLLNDSKYCLGSYLFNNSTINPMELYRKPTHYRGIVKDENSTDVRLSSIENRYDKPICHMSFNKDGFIKHCKEYKDYVDWVEHRNPIRYDENKDKQFDSKNVSHSFRLMNMCIEIANGEGFKVNRRGIDRKFLLDVKQHKYEYDDIIKMLDEKKKIMDEAIANSTLPDDIDIDFVNEFTIKVRKWQLGIQ